MIKNDQKWQKWPFLKSEKTCFSKKWPIFDPFLTKNDPFLTKNDPFLSRFRTEILGIVPKWPKMTKNGTKISFFQSVYQSRNQGTFWDSGYRREKGSKWLISLWGYGVKGPKQGWPVKNTFFDVLWVKKLTPFLVTFWGTLDQLLNVIWDPFFGPNTQYFCPKYS
jgi:hypothetical protein